MTVDNSKAPHNSKTIVAAAILMIAVIAVCMLFCCSYVSRELMTANENAAINSALIIRNNFDITDAEVEHLKTLTFNDMEHDPLNRRLADVATGVKFTEPIISIYIVTPLNGSEIKYVLDESTADFWGTSAGTPLDAVWLLNMAVDAQGQPVFAEREDIYRYTLTTDELKRAFNEKECFGTHTEDEWGDVITGYVPVYTTEGSFAGTLGVDLDISTYIKGIQGSMTAIISVLGIALLALAMLFFWMHKRVTAEETAKSRSEHEKALLLAGEKESLSSILNNISVGIYVYKFSGDDVSILAANQFVLELLGRNPEALKHARNSELTKYAHPEDVSKVQESFDTLRTAGSDIGIEFRLKSSKTGEYVWIMARGKSVEQPDGSVHAYVCLFDNSEQRKLREVETALQVAERSSKAKTDFLSNMSHDMRTPMNGILGLVTLMADQELPDDIRENLRQIQMSGRYLLNLINDTLDVSKIEAHKLVLHPCVSDTHRIIENIRVNSQMFAADKGVIFTIDQTKQPGMPVVLYIDEARVEQIFMNLLSNAIKFTPAGGSVMLIVERVETGSDYIVNRYQVKDTGIGMSEEFVKHIYEPFSQEGRTSTNREGGTGLGMTIAHQLIQLMGGTMEVSSELNVGTTFTITLRFCRYNGDAEQPDAVDTASIDLSGMNVLLCEDHPLNRQIAVKLLQKKGMNVDTAENGAVGVKMFADSKCGYYDLILMDIRMPVLDGIGATKQIRNMKRADYSTIPVIAMTANAFSEDVQNCLSAGMNAHMSKPVDVNKMYRLIEKWCRRSK